MMVVNCLFMIASCKMNKTIKEETNEDLNVEKETEVIPLEVDRVAVSINKFKEAFEGNNYELLNREFLGDTLFGDCIFYELNLGHLYDNGRTYLLKEEIINKEIFQQRHKTELINKLHFEKKREIIVSVNNSDDPEFESSMIYHFKLKNNKIILKSIYCAG